jgi:acetyl esterase/lipase
MAELDVPPVFQPTYDTPDTVVEPVVDSKGVSIIRDVEVAAAPGFRPLRLDLMVPPAEKPVPLVVYIHGGAFRFGSRRHSSPHSDLIWASLLDRGVAVASLEYRLSGEANFPACLHDVKAGVRWLRRYGSHFNLDGNRIGVWGESSGAHLAAFLGLNSTDDGLNGVLGVADESADVSAAVAWYPPTRFLTLDDEAPTESARYHDGVDSPESQLIGGALQEHPDAATYASPATHATSSAAPMLLLHGREDRMVPCGQSIALADALQGVGAEVELHLVDGADHVFAGVDPLPLIERSTAYLAQRLN